ncbi:hypothetical protein, partial [Candidatus Chlorohelix sp.]|uniref:hypothetical protein n=1 Tax=Candidatus Chlorohelix sp. TaxID=3139201 RepID=UPI0030384001
SKGFVNFRLDLVFRITLRLAYDSLKSLIATVVRQLGSFRIPTAEPITTLMGDIPVELKV